MSMTATSTISKLNVHCNGEHSSSYLTFTSSTGVEISIFCGNSYTCQNANITCPADGVCELFCEDLNSC